MSPTFPINLYLEGRPCLVVGGGRVAFRKTRSLIAAGAQVTVVSPAFCPELLRLEGLQLIDEPFGDHHVAGAILVFAATDDPEVNRRVAHAARQAGAWVNVVDTPAECDFIVPSVLARGELTLSVCSGGAAPALSRRLRESLEEQFPPAYAHYVALLAELRALILASIPDVARRRPILERLADAATWDLFQAEGPDAVRRLAEELIADAT